MIKVSNKMLNEFLELMEDCGEFVFGDREYLKKQLEMCLNSQGYWSGTSIRVFYDTKGKYFVAESRF